MKYKVQSAEYNHRLSEYITPVVAVGGKTTGIGCALQQSRELRTKVTSMDISDRHEAQQRVHTLAGKQR